MPAKQNMISRLSDKLSVHSKHSSTSSVPSITGVATSVSSATTAVPSVSEYGSSTQDRTSVTSLSQPAQSSPSKQKNPHVATIIKPLPTTEESEAMNISAKSPPPQAHPTLTPSASLSIPSSLTPGIQTSHPGSHRPAQPAATSTSQRKTGRYSLTDFYIHRTLGTGSFGRVHLVRSKHNMRYYAVKVLAKEKVYRMKQVEHTNSERAMLSRAHHPFIINLWGTFQDSVNLYMIMDFVAGGELFSLLRKSQRFPNPVAKFYAAEVALAIDYLHSLDIIYRDLKPENILINADGHIKITDFGFAKEVPDVTWTLCGTPDYLAPEIIQGKAYNKSVDWYALGVLVFEMLAGYPPFYTESSHPVHLYEKILAGQVTYPAFFDPQAVQLLKRFLTHDVTERYGNLKYGSKDVFAHPWFAEVVWDRLYKREIPAPYVPKIEGDGDASQFERYAENDIGQYGQMGSDPFADLFPDFN